MFDAAERKSLLFVFNVGALFLAGVWVLDVAGARSYGPQGALALAGVAVASAALVHYGREKFHLKSAYAALAYCGMAVAALLAAAAVWGKLGALNRTLAFLGAAFAVLPPLAFVFREEFLKQKG
ncbi:MAG: hypothetical protein QXH27_01515 [Candidatus Micrarchaeia archaeon]